MDMTTAQRLKTARRLMKQAERLTDSTNSFAGQDWPSWIIIAGCVSFWLLVFIGIVNYLLVDIFH